MRLREILLPGAHRYLEAHPTRLTLSIHARRCGETRAVVQNWIVGGTGHTAQVLPDPDVARLVAAHVETLRRHYPVPSKGVYSTCVECRHAWESGPISGCDDYVRAAEALGLTTTHEVREVTRRSGA